MSGLGAAGALGIGLASSGVASAATVVAHTYDCATPLGAKKVPATITTLSNTTPKTVERTHTYTAKPKMKATIPASLLSTAHTATPSLTELPMAASTLYVKKSGFSGPTKFAGTKKATLGTFVAIIPITTTTPNGTIHKGYVATITFTAGVFTVTVTSGKATLTPTKMSMHVLVTLTCYPPSQKVTYAGPTHTTLTHYTVVGTNTLTVLTTVNALPFVGPVTLTPAAGALPAGTQTAGYALHTYWTAKTGKTPYTWAATGEPTGLVFSHTGAHASLIGTPTVSGTFTVKVTVTTATAHSTSKTYTLHIAPKPSTPTVQQYFTLTVKAGPLTLNCGTADSPAPATDHNCTPIIHLGTITLNEKWQILSKTGEQLIVSTARGGATDDWTLTAKMVATPVSITHQAFCTTVHTFCNVTTTNSLARTTNPNSQITSNFFSVTGTTCKAQSTHTGPTQLFYNPNPNPTAGTGGSFGTYTPVSRLATNTTVRLCTAGQSPTPGPAHSAPGYTGGEFLIHPGTYTLEIPPTIYVGKYYGTVQYTLIPSV